MKDKTFSAPYIPILEYSYKQDERRLIPKGVSSWMIEQTSIRDTKVIPPTIEEKIKRSFTKTEMVNRQEPSTELEAWIRKTMVGQENAVIKCMYVHEKCTLVNTTSHFCEIKKCNHDSNHVYFYIDLKNNKIWQKCWDEKCIDKKPTARGKAYHVPLHLIKEYKPKSLSFVNWDTNDIIMDNFYKKASKY